MAGPTMHDVARMAGVSIMTVSRVVNGTDEVTPGTAKRVHDAIATLGYRLNPIARSLRTGQDQAVGLVVEYIADPFFASVIDAVEEACREAGLFLLIATGGKTGDEERAVIRGLLRRSVSGLVITPSKFSEGFEGLGLGPGGVPAVFIDRPPKGVEADVVMIDNGRVAGRATTHLIHYGHRRIAFVGTEVTTYPLDQRLEGYRRALAEAGIAFDPALVVDHERGATYPELVLGGPLGLSDPPTAVLSGNAVASVAVVREIHRTHREDLAIVSFDDFPIADSLTPPISVARQDPVEIGRRAFDLLRRRIAGSTAPPEISIVPTAFIARGSGEMPSPPPTKGAAHDRLDEHSPKRTGRRT